RPAHKPAPMPCRPIGWAKQGQGSALKPARGLCPLDPHQRRSLWDPSILFGAREGGAGPAWAVAIAPAVAGAMAAAQASLAPPSRAPNTTEGFQGPLPLAGIQGAAPLGGVQGRSPWPSFRRLDVPASAPRRLLARLRQVMASDAAPLGELARLLAAELVSEVCSIYVMRPGEILELAATHGLNPL